MSIPSLILIAFALSMDAFAVSISRGMAVQRLKQSDAIAIALTFGLFQAVMPVIGFAAGIGMRAIVSNLDHWVAFGLLLFVGGRMIVGAWREKQSSKTTDPLNSRTILILAVATSIDALVVGITFAFLQISLLLPVVLIGSITFGICLCGCYLGNRFSRLNEKTIETIGGLILIGIGAKILIEHLSQA